MMGAHGFQLAAPLLAWETALASLPGLLVLVLPYTQGQTQLWAGGRLLPAGLRAMKYSVPATSSLIFLHIQSGHSIDM